MRHNLSRLAVAVASLAAASAAHAQSIDYGSLEKMFNEPVTTSATGSPQRSTNSPVPMDIITADDIKRSGAVDIPTILNRLAGINVLTWGAASSDVGVRGYNQAKSPRLLVLINGRQVYIDSYGYTDWYGLPVRLEEIRQIEVVKGPNSALFGFNAVSGVINIVTYNPKYDKVDAAVATTGTQAYAGLDVVQTLKLSDKISARVSVGTSRMNEFSNSNHNSQLLPSSVQNPNLASASIDSIAQVTANLQVRLEGSWSNNQNSGVLPNSFYTRIDTVTNSKRITAIDESPIGLIEASVYSNEADAHFVEFGQVNWDNRVLVAKLQDLLKVGSNNTFRLAFEYRHNEMNSSPDDSGSVYYNVYSPSVMWTSTLTKQLSATVALRYDELNLGYSGTFPSVVQLTPAEFNRSIGAVSANAGLLFNATDVDTFRASYARGVQSPTLAELGGYRSSLISVQVPVPVDITGNPSIQPSIVSNYELDWDRDLPQIAAKANLRVYYQTTSEVKGIPDASGLNLYPVFVPALKYPTIWFTNVGDSSMTGLEAAISGVVGKAWRWNANYTYTDVRDDAHGADLLGHFADFAKTTPKHTANLGLGWTGGPWTLDGWAHYVSGYEDYPITYALPYFVKVDGYVTVDARVAYRIAPQLTFAVSGQQLNASRTVETVGLPVERRVFASVAANW
jgi:iron complex outermembrane receptor protein